MLEYLAMSFHMELMLFDNFLVIIDPFVELMIVRGQMGVHNTNRYAVARESNAHCSFVALRESRPLITPFALGSFVSVAHSPTYRPVQCACTPIQRRAHAANSYV